MCVTLVLFCPPSAPEPGTIIIAPILLAIVLALHAHLLRGKALVPGLRTIGDKCGRDAMQLGGNILGATWLI